VKDPFGLLIESKRQKAPNPKRVYLMIIGVLSSLVIILVFYAIFSRYTVNADIPVNSSASIKLSGIPQQINTGDQIVATISVANSGNSAIPNTFVLVQGSGIDLQQSVLINEGFSQSTPGYMRELNLGELAEFDSPGDGGIYWYVGNLPAKQSLTQQIKGTIAVGSDAGARIDTKYYRQSGGDSGCGFLGLSPCQNSNPIQLAVNSFQLKISNTSKIKLNAGYNYITLPYVFPASSIKDFLSTLRNKWAYYYKPTTGEYVSLLTDENAELVKPGIGFWLYDTQGGEYDLPETKVETNINESFTINLEVGWNQLGNPYPKRIVFSQDEILVREVADDGTVSGTIYSLKSAIENGVLSDAYIVSYKGTSGTDSPSVTNSLEYQKLMPDSLLNAFAGFTIKTEKKVVMTFPGRDIIAAGDLISSEESRKIESWIIKNGLNQYGDTVGTVYAGGTPLIDEKTGKTLDRLDYILTKHPDRPWNR